MNKNSEAYKMLNDLSFCVFDLETTGGNQKNDKIIEIGLVKVKNLEITERKDFLIQPQIKIPEFIQKLTTIKPEDVKDSPLIEEVIDEILEFMGDSVLVAHNTSFDIPFFNSVLRRLGREELKNKSLCTNLMTKYLIPNLMNSNLNYMSKIFGIDHHKAHRALDDALASADLLINYLKIFIEKDIQKVNHLYYPRGRYELNRINFKVEEDKPKDILEKVKSLKTSFMITLKGKNGVILFSLPCLGNGHQQECDYISSQISELDWETITIKLLGPFIESLIQFNGHFPKIEPKLKAKTMDFLWTVHLGKAIPLSAEEETAPRSSLDLTDEFGDFIIVNHLVPDQYLIYPLQTLNHKSSLTFRYPGHKKKLLQFINSRTNKMKSGKIKRTMIQIGMRKFIEAYLKNAKASSELLFFKSKLPLKAEEQFVIELESYLKKNPNSYNYPKEYI